MSQAVLIVAWRRPDLVRTLLAQLSHWRGLRIYVAVDGPRGSVPADETDCAATREIIDSFAAEQSIARRYQPKNLGLKAHIVSSIDWFFSFEREGVILEEDVLPTKEFMSFSRELLLRFRRNPKVAQISGANHAPGLQPVDSDYYFSQLQHVWGFATWSNRWRGFSSFLSSGKQFTIPEIEQLFPSLPSGFHKHWTQRTNAELAGESRTWTAAWNTFCALHGRLSVVPSFPLVENTGLGADATHHRSIPLLAGVMARPKPFRDPLQHPQELVANAALDDYVAATQWATQSAPKRLLFALTESLRRLLTRELIRYQLEQREGNRLSGGSKGNRPYLTVAQHLWLHRSRNETQTLKSAELSFPRAP